MKKCFTKFFMDKIKCEKGNFDMGEEGESVTDASVDEGVETFDDLDTMNFEEDEEEEPDEEEDEATQADRIDAEEVGRDEDEEPSEEERTEEPKEEKEETSENEVPKIEGGKAIKARLGDERFELDETMEFMAKVDGKREKVNLRTLIDNYSGKTAWDRKFTELGQQKKHFEQEATQFKAERDQIVSSITQARAKIEKALKGGGDPREGINYLLDLMGYDTYNFNVALTNAMYGDVAMLSNMTEEAREAYWYKKELEYTKSRNGNLEQTRRAEQEKLAHRQNVENLRRTHGVSEEAFTKAFNDLVGRGEQNPYIMDVINQAKYASVADTAIELCNQYEEDLSSQELEDLEIKVADFLSKNPNYPVNELKSYLDEKYKVGGAVKKLTSKAKPKVTKPTIEPKGGDGLETFDDLLGYY